MHHDRIKTPTQQVVNRQFPKLRKITKKTYITPQTKDMKPIHTNAARLKNKIVKPDSSDK
jgi:hypothetical protein